MAQVPDGSFTEARRLMSAKIMGAVFDLDLPAAKQLVLLAMADHADHDGRNIYPSLALIAWKCGYSESQTRRIIQSLVADRLLEKHERPGKTTIFSIHLEAGKRKQPLPKRDPSQNDTPAIAVTPLTPDKMSAHPYHSYDTPTPTIAMTPEPSFEPIDSTDSSIDSSIESYSRAKPDARMRTQLYQQAARLGSSTFARVVERCRGRTWGYLLTALRREAPPRGDPTGEDFIGGAFASFIEH